MSSLRGFSKVGYERVVRKVSGVRYVKVEVERSECEERRAWYMTEGKRTRGLGGVVKVLLALEGVNAVDE